MPSTGQNIDKNKLPLELPQMAGRNIIGVPLHDHINLAHLQELLAAVLALQVP